MTSDRFKIYLIAVLTVFALFAVMNYLSFSRSIGCADCLISYGFPLPLYEEGGFITIERMLWSGLVADLYLALSLGLLLGWACQRFLLRRLER